MADLGILPVVAVLLVLAAAALVLAWYDPPSDRHPDEGGDVCC